MEKKKITGCIVTYNNADSILPCLESVFKSTESLDFTLYISDNDSTDQTISLIRENFPQAVILENKNNGGFGWGHNRVLSLLDSAYHFVINPDIVADDSSFASLVDYLEQHPEVEMITPKILNTDGSEQQLPKWDPTIRFTILSKFKRWSGYRSIYTREKEELNEPTEINFCTGCFFCIRTEVYKKLQGFDERYFMYLEDADLSRRVREIGKVIFYPDATIYHDWHRENTRTASGILRWIKSMVKYSNKWGWKF